MRRVLGHQVGACAVKRLAVLRNRVGEIPDHGARLGIAKRMATMHLHDNPLDAAAQVGLPVLAFSAGLLGVSQVVPPTQLFEQHMIELGVAGGDVGAQ